MTETETLHKLRGCFTFGLEVPPAAADRGADAVFSLDLADDAAQELVISFPTP